MVDCDAEVESFLGAARLLEDKLLCCVLQFGYFNRSIFASGDEFMERLLPFLDKWPKDVSVAVEIRNKTWISAQLLDSLRARDVSFVVTDQAWMPPPLSLAKAECGYRAARLPAAAGRPQ